MVWPLIAKWLVVGVPSAIKFVDVLIKSRNLVPKVNNSSWIRLNVGGKVFLTTKHTLVSEESIFRLLLEDEPTEKLSILSARYWSNYWKRKREKSSQEDAGALDMDAYYHIRMKDSRTLYLDRDARHFEPILNYLRHGKLIKTKHVTSEGIMEEAAYFQVWKLVELIEREKGLTRPQLPTALPLYDSTQLVRRTVEHRQRKLAAKDLYGPDVELNYVRIKGLPPPQEVMPRRKTWEERIEEFLT